MTVTRTVRTRPGAGFRRLLGIAASVLLMVAGFSVADAIGTQSTAAAQTCPQGWMMKAEATNRNFTLRIFESTDGQRRHVGQALALHGPIDVVAVHGDSSLGTVRLQSGTSWCSRTARGARDLGVPSQRPLPSVHHLSAGRQGERLPLSHTCPYRGASCFGPSGLQRLEARSEQAR
jgi:hypothetical protein